MWDLIKGSTTSYKRFHEHSAKTAIHFLPVQANGCDTCSLSCRHQMAPRAACLISSRELWPSSATRAALKYCVDICMHINYTYVKNIINISTETYSMPTHDNIHALEFKTVTWLLWLKIDWKSTDFIYETETIFAQVATDLSHDDWKLQSMQNLVGSHWTTSPDAPYVQTIVFKATFLFSSYNWQHFFFVRRAEQLV